MPVGIQRSAQVLEAPLLTLLNDTCEPTSEPESSWPSDAPVIAQRFQSNLNAAYALQIGPESTEIPNGINGGGTTIRHV